MSSCPPHPDLTPCTSQGVFYEGHFDGSDSHAGWEYYACDDLKDSAGKDNTIGAIGAFDLGDECALSMMQRCKTVQAFA